MKKDLLNKIIEKKKKKSEFLIITNLENAEGCIYEKDKPIDKNFEKYKEKINFFSERKKNGIIDNTNIFVENYIQPIKVFIVGAVHIAQYIINFAKLKRRLELQKINFIYLLLTTQFIRKIALSAGGN